MKKRPLGFLYAAALILTGAVWIVAGGRNVPNRKPTQPAPVFEPRLSPARAPAVDLPRLERPPNALHAEGSQGGEAPEWAYAEVGETSAAHAAEWAQPEGLHWVHGRVIRPEGTPGDETLWVSAQGAPFSEDVGARDTHTVIVADTGTFRVAFSSGTGEQGSLRVRGRYCYMDQPLLVPLADLDREVVLEPKLGGRVVVTVTPPRAEGFKALSLERIRVSAARANSPSSMATDGWARADGRFEIGGLAPSADHGVGVRSKLYVDRLVEGVRVQPGETTDLSVPLLRDEKLELDSETIRRLQELGYTTDDD